MFNNIIFRGFKNGGVGLLFAIGEPVALASRAASATLVSESNCGSLLLLTILATDANNSVGDNNGTGGIEPKALALALALQLLLLLLFEDVPPPAAADVFVSNVCFAEAEAEPADNDRSIEEDNAVA